MEPAGPEVFLDNSQSDPVPLKDEAAPDSASAPAATAPPTTILDLTEHVLALILTRLRLPDIAHFAATCHKAQAVFTDGSLLWHPLCVKMGLRHDPADWGGASAMETYRHILKPYAKMLGWWHSSSHPFGSLLHVCIEKGAVAAYIASVYSFNAPLARAPIMKVRFKGTPSGGRLAVAECCRQAETHLSAVELRHACEVTFHVPARASSTAAGARTPQAASAPSGHASQKPDGETEADGDSVALGDFLAQLRQELAAASGSAAATSTAAPAGGAAAVSSSVHGSAAMVAANMAAPRVDAEVAAAAAAAIRRPGGAAEDEQAEPLPVGFTMRCAHSCNHAVCEIFSRHHSEPGRGSGAAVWLPAGPESPSVPAVHHGLPGPAPELLPRHRPGAAAQWLTHNLMQFQRYMVVRANYALQTEKSRYQRLQLPPAAQAPAAGANSAAESFEDCTAGSSGRHFLEGVWAGTYGSHGLELLNITAAGSGGSTSAGSSGAGTSGGSRSSATGILTATKLTGDVSVPSGEVSFEIDLATASNEGAGLPFRLPPDFQSDVELPPAHLVSGSSASRAAAAAGRRAADPSSASAATGKEADGDPARSQAPLLVQRECYGGRARIAMLGLTAPQWVPAEALVFSPDCFALLWHTLDSVSLFCRVALQ